MSYKQYQKNMKGQIISEYNDIAEDIDIFIMKASEYGNQQWLEFLLDIREKKLIQGTRIIASFYLLCELHEKYTYDADYVKILTDFAERCVKVPQGAHGNIILAPVQKFIVGLLHGFNRGGEKPIHTLFYLVARGSGKTALTSLLAIIQLLVNQELGGHIAIVAPTTKQSKLLYDFATTTIRTSKQPFEGLLEKWLIKPTRDSIRNNITRSDMTILANDSSNLDGLSLSLAIIDEMHELKENILPVLTQGSRIKKPDTWQAIVITTDGVLRGYAIDEMKERADKILFGEIPYSDTFPLMFSLDDGDDWENHELWSKSNSMLGHLVSKKQLIDLYNASLGSPTEVSQFKAKILNMPQSAFNQYIFPEDIERMDEDLWDELGDDVVVGIDLALTSDIASFVFMKRHDDEELYAIRTLNFMTRKSYDQQDFQSQHILGGANDLIIIEEDLIDGRMCYQHVKDYIDANNLAPVAFMYDEWKSSLLLELAKDDFAIMGADIMPVKQTTIGLSPPMQRSKALLEAGRLKSTSDMLAWCMLNVRARIDANLNTFPNKSRSINKIDTYVSMLNALAYFDTLESTRYFNIID